MSVEAAVSILLAEPLLVLAAFEVNLVCTTFQDSPDLLPRQASLHGDDERRNPGGERCCRRRAAEVLCIRALCRVSSIRGRHIRRRDALTIPVLIAAGRREGHACPVVAVFGSLPSVVRRAYGEGFRVARRKADAGRVLVARRAAHAAAFAATSSADDVFDGRLYVCVPWNSPTARDYIRMEARVPNAVRDAGVWGQVRSGEDLDRKNTAAIGDAEATL